MTRLVLDVDHDLLVQAQRILGLASSVATIHEALRLVVAWSALDDTVKYFATLDEDQQRALECVRDDQW